MSYSQNHRTQLKDQSESPFKSAYSQKLKIQIAFPDDSPHTRQEFADECDINNIMKQYEATGQLFHINEDAPQYLDCSGDDFRDCMDYVAGAFSMFEELPSKIRSQFDNDPAAFLEFCSQEKNRPELAAMGLLSDEAMTALTTPPTTPPAVPTAPTAPVTPTVDTSTKPA